MLEKLSESWDKKFRETATKDRFLSLIESIARDMQERLRREVFSLEKRANLNLVIGFSISLIGLVTLGWFVFQTSIEIRSDIDLPEIAMRFAVRLSVVIFIQIFAYFFLRLYRAALFDIKYFQNEITSTQFRIIALEAALKMDDKKILDKLCASLVVSERNTLKKGEISQIIRQSELEAKQDQSIISTLERTIQNLSSRSSEVKS